MVKNDNAKAIIIVFLIIIAIILLFLFIKSRKITPSTTSEFLGKEVTFKASDGKTIKAYLSKPVGNEKFPAVILLHGGVSDTASSRNLGKGAHSKGLKENGYVVLSVDYRKSEYGGKELDDVIDAVSYLKTLSYVDSNKIGIVGYSHGAYLTIAAATRLGSQIQVAVENFGSANLSSTYHERVVFNITCDKEDRRKELIEMAINHFGGSPETGNSLWIERSPINYIKNIQAPILIIHGKKDCLILPNHAYELESALKASNKEYEIKFYENSGHGFVHTNSQESVEANQYTLNFLNKNLK